MKLRLNIILFIVGTFCGINLISGDDNTEDLYCRIYTAMADSNGYDALSIFNILLQQPEIVVKNLNFAQLAFLTDIILSSTRTAAGVYGTYRGEFVKCNCSKLNDTEIAKLLYFNITYPDKSTQWVRLDKILENSTVANVKPTDKTMVQVQGFQSDCFKPGGPDQIPLNLSDWVNMGASEWTDLNVTTMNLDYGSSGFGCCGYNQLIYCCLRKAARVNAMAIHALNLTSVEEQVMIAGHSLGGQFVGLIAQQYTLLYNKQLLKVIGLDPVGQGYDYNYWGDNIAGIPFTVTARPGFPAPGIETLVILSSHVGTTNTSAAKLNVLVNYPLWCQYQPFCDQKNVTISNVTALIPSTCPINTQSSEFATGNSCSTASTNCGHFQAVHLYLKLIKAVCKFIYGRDLRLYPHITPQDGCYPIYINSKYFADHFCYSII